MQATRAPPGGREREEQPVTGGIYPLAALRLHGGAYEPMMIVQQRRVRVSKLSEEARGAVNVREYEADRPRAAIGHRVYHPPSSRMIRCRTRPATSRR